MTKDIIKDVIAIGAMVRKGEIKLRFHYRSRTINGTKTLRAFGFIVMPKNWSASKKFDETMTRIVDGIEYKLPPVGANKK